MPPIVQSDSTEHGRSRPGLHPLELVRLAVSAAMRGRTRSVVSAGVVAMAVVAIVASTGRTATLEREVRERLEDPSARVIRVTDRNGQADLRGEDLHRVGSLSAVSWYLGLDAAGSTVRNMFAGAPTTGFARPSVGIRQYAGELLYPDLATLTTGRLPEPGEAVVGSTAARELGLADGRGVVSSGDAPITVVGVVAFRGALADLDGYVLFNPAPLALNDTMRVGTVILVARSSIEVDALASTASGTLAAVDPLSLVVEASSDRIELVRQLAGSIGDLDAAILIGALVMGGLIVSINQFGVVSARRREIGLRRIQGAESSTIVALVLVEMGVLGVLGSLLGLVAGMLVVAGSTGAALELPLGASVALLVFLAGLAGTVPPALSAGRQEPLYALRGG